MDRYLNWSEATSYKEILKFIKKTFKSGTHICRRSGAEILRKQVLLNLLLSYMGIGHNRTFFQNRI